MLEKICCPQVVRSGCRRCSKTGSALRDGVNNLDGTTKVPDSIINAICIELSVVYNQFYFQY
jgi:hypothetical protein